MFYYIFAFALLKCVSSECTNKFIIQEHWNSKYQIDTGRYLHTLLMKNGGEFLPNPFENETDEVELMEFSHNNLRKDFLSGVKIYQICNGDYKKVGIIHKKIDYYPIGYSLKQYNMDSFNEELYNLGFNVHMKFNKKIENESDDDKFFSYVVKKIPLISCGLVIIYLVFCV